MTTNKHEKPRLDHPLAVEAMQAAMAAAPQTVEMLMNDGRRDPMTLPEAAELYMTIRGLAIAGDDEAAHSSEDRLMRAAIDAVVAGHPDGMNLARFAAMAGDLDFRRSM
jgi:hypothetical protein